MVKLMSAAVCLAAACAIGLGAQSSTTEVTTGHGDGKTKTKTKVEVTGGKDISTDGCVEASPGGGYMLTNAGTGALRYTLVTDDDLSKYVGHRVRVSGKATDHGDGKVKITSHTVAKDPERSGAAKETDVTTESKGGSDFPYLGLKSVRITAGRCS